MQSNAYKNLLWQSPDHGWFCIVLFKSFYCAKHSACVVVLLAVATEEGARALCA